MAQDQISQLFNIQEIEANAQQALDVVRQKVVEINKLQEQILKSDSASSNNSNTKAASASLNELSLNIKLYNDLLKQNEIITARMNVMTSEAAKTQLELKQKMAETSKEARLESVASNELASAYEKLNAQHKLAVLSYQNMAASGKASAVQLNAQKDAANALGEQLAKIDQATGNYRRNVGNYTSTWNGLGNSINQITRELPNFAQSFQLGLLAISNNLPILQDELGRAREKIDDLKKAGKDTPSLFSQIASSVFSWQTALTLAISGAMLLIQYLSKSSDENKKMSESAKENAESQKNLSDSIANELTEMNNLLKIAQDTNLTYKKRGDAVDELQKRFPDYFLSLNREKILNGDVADATNMATQAIIKKAKETARLEKYNKVLSELTNLEIDLERMTTNNAGNFNYYTNEQKSQLEAKIAAKRTELKSIENGYNAQNAFGINEAYWLDNNLKKQYEANQAKQKALALMTEEERKQYERDLKKKPKKDKFEDEKDAIAAQKAIAQDESNNYDVRYAAANKFYKLNRDLLKKEGKLNTDNLIVLSKETNDLQKKAYDDQVKLLEKNSKEKAQIIFDQMNNIAENENIDRNKRLNALDEEFAKGKMRIDAYNAERQKINEEYDAKILQNQIDSLNEYLKELGLEPAEISKIQEKITDLTNQQLDKRKKKRNLDAEEKKKLLDQEKEYQIQIIKEVTSFIFNSLKARNDQELKALEQQKTAISETYDLKRKAVEDAAISDEEKAKRKAVLDAEEAYRQKELDKLIREQKRKQAILNKTQALADIAINTAVAVSKLVASTGGWGSPLIPYIIALGAVQAASVVATPIPEYAKGKKSTDSYEGLAIAGEAGTELLIDKDGKSTLLDKPTLIHTRRGDTILSNEQLKKGATANNANNGYKLSNEDIINALGYNIGALRKDIRNQGERVIPIDQTRYFDLRRAARK